MTEKMAFALVGTTQWLRPYFQAHAIRILTDHPLRTILHKLKTSRRLVKWSIELSEFDIEYHPQGAIKGQVVADFITEYTYMMGTETEQQHEPSKEADQVEWVIM